MKDLKHLIFFENLLQNAQNELVTQAVNDGKSPSGTTAITSPRFCSICLAASRAVCAPRASPPTWRPTT
ncbi:MAG: hypothetical protein ACLRRN_04125 [Oscillospiraceae bacterium]